MELVHLKQISHNVIDILNNWMLNHDGVIQEHGRQTNLNVEGSPKYYQRQGRQH